MLAEPQGSDSKIDGTAHDDDAAKSRTRVSRACTRCRTRKDRCDGQRPSCAACVNAQQVCCYEPSTKKRGLPEGYVRGLEKLYALLVSKVEGFEDVTSALLRDNRPRLSKIWNHVTVGEDLHTTWKDSKINTELERLLSSLDQTATATGQKRKRDKDDDGSADDNEVDANFHLQPMYHISNLTSHSFARKLEKTAPHTVLQLPEQSLQLLDHYFAHTNCWFPILRRSDLTRACYEMARGQGGESSKAIAPLLWAVFAYALKQLNHSGYNDLAKSTLSSESAEGMRNTSLELIPEDAEHCTLIHAQAMLVIALIDIGMNHWKSAWTLVGKAVRIVLADFPSHKTLEKATVPTLQGCVILDTAIASHYNCVPHLRRQDVESVPRLTEDGHEEWEPWNGSDGFRGQREPSFAISCFNRLTEIFLCIGDVLTMYRPLETLSKEHIQNLLAKLHELQASFPGAMPPTSHSPPHQIYLQLCHVSAQIRLVEIPVETGARSNEKAKLACNVLSLLGLCKNAPAIGLAHIPPFLYDGCRAALRLAHASMDCFGSVSGLPSIEDFQQTASEYFADLSSLWPVFASISTDLMNQSMHGAVSDVVSLERGSIAGNLLSESAVDPLRAAEFVTHQKSHGLNGSSDGTIFDSWSQGADGLFNGSMTVEQNNSMLETSLGTLYQKYSDNFSVSPAGLSGSHLNEHAMVEASPSFHGDEIDAIFHEMAHLDTNEWTSERATGLKDFGFDDDMTFQAFCNDPNRLTGPGNGPQTLSSSLQTWMFTNDPS